jgi:magnesium transporter
VTEQPAARPAPLSRVWSGSKVIAEDLEDDDLSDVLELHAEASAWWLLPRDSERAVRQLHDVAKALDLDDDAINDLLANDGRAKFEELGQARIVIANAVSLDPKLGRLEEHPVSLVVTDRVLICTADRFDGFHPATALAGKEPWLAMGGSEAALQAVVAAMIGTYERVADWLEDATDQLAGAVLEERPLDGSEQIWAFRLRAVLSQLRRLTEPMRTVISELAGSAPESTPKPTHVAITRHWRLLSERHQRVANTADALRERLASITDTSLALTDLRTNEVITKLSARAAIIVYLLVALVAGIALYLALWAKNWV